MARKPVINPSEKWKNLYNPQLSNSQIRDLFSQYGLQGRLQKESDYDWIRKNLPTDAKNLEKLLRIEMDMQNKARRDNYKNKPQSIQNQEVIDADFEEVERLKSTPVSEPQASPGEQAPLTNPLTRGGLGGSPDGKGGPNDLTIQNLLNDSRVQNDRGVNGVTMAQWLQGNASLFPQLARLGYTLDDLINEAYSQTRYNRSAFQGDMTTTPRGQNTPYTQPSSGSSSAGATSPSNLTSTQGMAEYGISGTSSNSSLVKFSSDPNGDLPGDQSTIWWVDHDTKTFRPITSMQALRDLYPPGQEGLAAYQQALDSLTVINPSELNNGVMQGYIDLGWEYRISEGGEYKKLEFNPSSLQNSYGQPFNQNEDLAGIATLNAWLKFLKIYGSDVEGVNGLKTGLIDEIKQDSLVMALYIHGLTNGGYTPNDIYMDMRRRQLIAEGRTDLEDVVIIHPNITRQQYEATSQGQYAYSLNELMPPSDIGGMSAELWNSPLARLSDEFYQLADPAKYDPNSPEFREGMNNLALDFYEYFYENLKSGLDRDKMLADSEWENFVKKIEMKYGYRLADNALDAWREVEAITNESAESGLIMSGITEEEHQKVLRYYREQNRRERETRDFEIKEESDKKIRASASPEEIHAMNMEDQAAGLPRTEWRAFKLGLVPLEEMNFQKFLADFRERFPDSKLSDDDVKGRYYDQMYDDNGNYRSTLYQNYQNNISKQKYGFVLSDIYGYSEIEAREDRYMQQMLDEEAKSQRDSLGPFGSQTEDMINYEDSGISELQGMMSGSGSGATPNATLSSPDGRHKVAVVSGSAEASALLSEGWTLGDSGREPIQLSEVWNTYNITPPSGAGDTLWRPSTPQHVYIPTTADIPNYRNIEKDPNSNKLYGIPNNQGAGTTPSSTPNYPGAPSTPATPSSSPASSPYGSTSPSTPSGQASGQSGAFDPGGRTHIPSPDVLGQYYDIIRDPATGKMYGRKREETGQNNQNFTVPPGYTHIPNVSDMINYTDIIRDPNTGKLYGKRK